MQDHFPQTKIIELDLPLDEDENNYDSILENFFTSNPHIHHCITLCSKGHIVGEFLLKTNRRDVQIMGYDMVEKNCEMLTIRNNIIPHRPTCLHAGLQLCRYII